MTVAAICFAQLAVIVLLLWDRRSERREHAHQVAELCQRIQAPELAILAHQQEDDTPLPQPPGFDDDGAYWRSRDELAEALP
jgi:hypothetical protein